MTDLVKAMTDLVNSTKFPVSYMKKSLKLGKDAVKVVFDVKSDQQSLHFFPLFK